MNQPLVMGIINVTPDSFYSESRKQDHQSLLSLAEKMLQDGASILDVGGQSTRPGAEEISEEEELNRVIPAIETIHAAFPDAIISIDTYRTSIAEAAINAGASIINDISAGAFDKDMITTVAKLKVPYIIMHTKGKPSEMQHQTNYDDLIKEMLDYFIEKTHTCKRAGIHDVIIDPGFGFAKNIQQNFHLLKNLEVFKMLDRPILAGLSRKSTIYKTLNVTADEALNGTTAMHAFALMNGANILRVHDVKEAVETVKLWKKLNSE